MTTMEEYDEMLGYDADHSDPGQYCQHGTFIGSWWGPDYLCGWCEDGISRADQVLFQKNNEVRRLLKEVTEAQEVFDIMAQVADENPGKRWRLVQWLVNWTWESDRYSGNVVGIGANALQTLTERGFYAGRCPMYGCDRPRALLSSGLQIHCVRHSLRLALADRRYY